MLKPCVERSRVYAQISQVCKLPCDEGRIHMVKRRFIHLSATLLIAVIQGCSSLKGLHSTADWSDPQHLQNAPSKSPIPYAESVLPSRVASEFAKVTASNTVLEGASLDRAAALVYSDVMGRRLMRMSPNGQSAAIVSFSQGNPGGTAIHRDGEIYVAIISGQYTGGSIVAVSPDGRSQRTVVDADKGFVPNDLVFDTAGGFYFTDFRGNSTDSSGGVYYVSPDASTITPVLQHLSLANGVALSPDGKTLWVTEYGRNLLHKIKLDTATTVGSLGTSVPYRFTGAGPDSMRVDSAGNVYVAMMEQGRVMVFAPNGVPVGQILLPGRDEGHNLESASLAISPWNNGMYIVAGDGEGGRGASIFHSQSLANGLTLFSHH